MKNVIALILNRKPVNVAFLAFWLAYLTCIILCSSLISHLAALNSEIKFILSFLRQDEENPITRAENFLLSRLGTRCRGKTPEDFENILITLKAIGNAGRPVAAENVLLKCALNPHAPVNMSIAALEAFRRLPCNEEMTGQILEIYGEYNLDVEIRIAAYLALMKCPSPEVFKRVAEILKNEVNNQVGSFVWSHMTNAMDSTEPVHGLPQAEMMKDALNGMKLREFNLNRLRFSRAWEGSFYSGKIIVLTSHYPTLTKQDMQVMRM